MLHFPAASQVELLDDDFLSATYGNSCCFGAPEVFQKNFSGLETSKQLPRPHVAGDVAMWIHWPESDLDKGEKPTEEVPCHQLYGFFQWFSSPSLQVATNYPGKNADFGELDRCWNPHQLDGPKHPWLNWNLGSSTPILLSIFSKMEIYGIYMEVS